MLKAAKGEFKDNPVRYINIQIRYKTGIDPDSLTDEEWAETWAILQNIRQEEAKNK